MMEFRTLDEIKMELQELRRLYQTLVDKLVPLVEASEDKVYIINSTCLTNSPIDSV